MAKEKGFSWKKTAKKTTTRKKRTKKNYKSKIKGGGKSTSRKNTDEIALILFSK